MGWHVKRLAETLDGSVVGSPTTYFSRAGSPEAARQEAAVALGCSPLELVVEPYTPNSARVAEGPDGQILKPFTKPELERMVGRNLSNAEYETFMRGGDL
jgi:hypothetical protein